MFFERVKTIKLSDYFRIIKPAYSYIKIIPHKSNRNYNTTTIAKSIANTYRSIDKRIRKEEKKLIIESNFKISYMIDIYKDDVSFYFIIPEFFEYIILDKIKEIWYKATVEKVDNIPEFGSKSSIYELSYKKDDVLSLRVDKKNNEPLNQILNTINLLKDDDRLTVFYNFRPTRLDWNSRYETTMKKIKSNENLDKKSMTLEYILKSSLYMLVSILNSIMEILSDLAGAKDKKEEVIFNTLIKQFNIKEISSNTYNKRDKSIVNTQIAVISDSKDKIRRENNAIALCQAFRCLDEDNELRYRKKRVKKIFKVIDCDIKIKSNLCSTDEVNNFIQLPGRSLVEEHKITHINIEETKLPDELKEGIKYLGTSTYKGSKEKAYLENEYNIGNLPLVLIGAQGGGKSTFIVNYANDCIKAGEGVVVIDFIKGCELSNTIERLVPKDKLIVLDLSKEKEIPGLGYNEIVVNKNMSLFEKLNLANMQSQQIMNFVDSISVGDPLSSRMRRFLNAAANVVMVQGYNSIKNVVECLENYEKREFYINNLYMDLLEQLEDEINTLRELNEINKDGEIIGTKSSKIEHILDRISLLREDFKLKYMYNKNLRNNVNLVDCMQQGKVVLIKMKEDDFPTKMIKNVMVTYWISKIWLSSQIRGSISDKPLRTNVIVDEVFQAPTSMRILEYILPQSRKFGCKFIFSTQYMRQLNSIADVLEASGASYMLLKGCLEDDFNHLKNKIKNFEFEDLRDMEQYSSLNLIYYSKGYASFITKLPKPK